MPEKHTIYKYGIVFLKDDQVAELEEKSVEIFTEGLSTVAGTSSETELWTRYIGWCEERQLDKNVSEDLREKASGPFYSIVGNF